MAWIDNSQGIDRVSITDENTDQPIPIAALIVGDRGSGKTTVAEGIKNYYRENGYTVITIADAKDDLEAAFSMFEVAAPYHLRKLRQTGTPIKKIPTKIYHPLTLNIDTEKRYPKIEWFSIDIKELTRIELAYLAETEKNTTSIQLCLETIRELSNNEGIHHLVYKTEEKTESQIEIAKKVRLRSDKAEDFFSKTKVGTDKTAGEIHKYFMPFLKDYSITPHNYHRNINIVEIMNDQKNHHVFTYKYIQDKRLKSFYIIHILQQIIRHKDKMRYPIIIHIPEIKYLLPQKSDGFTTYLAQAISDIIATMRSNGIGIIADTQVYSDTNTIVTNVMSEHFIGKMTSLKEYDYIGKALRLGKTDIDKMRALKIGRWITKTINKNMNETKLEEMQFYMPPHAHKEVFEKFEEKYSKHTNQKT